MKKSMHRFTSVAGALSLLCGQMFASSHSDAPLSKQDPQTNLTDVYGFITPGNTLTIVVNCRPFSEPGDGVMYERFADDAQYTINIANPVTGALLKSYNFQFSPVASDAGDIWADLTLGTNTFNPLVLASGTGGVINVTITPSKSDVGKTVKGYIYVDTFNPVVGTGDEVVRIPYTYTVTE